MTNRQIRKQDVVMTVAAVAGIVSLTAWLLAIQHHSSPATESAAQPLAASNGGAVSHKITDGSSPLQDIAAAASSKPVTNQWGAKFGAANDYRAFIADALPAALAGDGRAALYIGDAISRCALVVKTYRGSDDPEAQLNQELAAMTPAPQWTKDLQATQTRRCLALAKRDPFAELPAVEGGYTSKYWAAQALADGDALAQARAAAAMLTDIAGTQGMSDNDRTAKLKATDENLRAAVESGDPDGLYAAGMLLADGRYSADPLNGIAVELAACDLGHDCSAKNPDNVFSTCAVSGACPADADLAYYLQKSLDPDQYSKAYALSQTIQNAARQGDWDTVMGYLKVRL
jgi:hypothetical protein